MMRLIPKQVWFCATVSTLVFQCAAWSQWSSYPPIDVPYLVQQHDQDWFHVSQCCCLWIEGKDQDSYDCEVLPGNYIEPYRCKWHGENLSDRIGVETVWQAEHFTTSANEVYLDVNDSPWYPAWELTDDATVRSPSASLNAWEVKVTMSIGGSSKVITEKGWGPGVDGTIAFLQGNLNGEPVTADTSPYATDDGPYPFVVQKDVAWQLGPVPNGAETYTATGAADVHGTMSGTLTAQTDDDDPDPLGGGSMSVSVVVKPPGSPLGVSVSFTPNLSEACESVAGIGFGFASDALACCGGMNEYTVAKASGDYTNDGSVNFSHMNFNAMSGAVQPGVTKVGQLLIKGYVKALGYSEFIEPYPYWVYWNSSASVSSSGSYTFGVSNARASNLHSKPNPRYYY